MVVGKSVRGSHTLLEWLRGSEPESPCIYRASRSHLHRPGESTSEAARLTVRDCGAAGPAGTERVTFGSL